MSPSELLPMDGKFHIELLYLHWQMYCLIFLGRTDMPGWAPLLLFPIAGFIIWLVCTLQVATALYCDPLSSFFVVPIASWFLVNYVMPRLETKLFGTKGLRMFSAILTCGMLAYAGVQVVENRLVKAIRRTHV